LVNFVDAFQTFGWYLFFVGALAIVTVSFFVFNWAENKSVLTWRGFSLQKLCAYCGLAIIASVLVHFSIGWLNLTIYSREAEYYTALRGNFFGEFILVFFTAVMPALFEELGFRGYLLQTLLKVADVQQAVYISSFLFAIIHMSFISLFWLIPFALFIGFVRTKEGTLWYGVFIHFFFNLTACMFLLSGV
jgi:membrane protease YdiL (CAAX protease family)